MWQSIVSFLYNNTPLLYLTQSLWRDEAFSVWIAQDSLVTLIQRTSGDFNPPLYYILLHFWMRLFGDSEIALRSLSLLFFGLFLIVTYKFAQKVFKNNYLAKMTTLIMMLNPMLLYFAFEVRMYSLLVLTTACSMYFLYAKKWKWYALVTVLGMYTQPFMAFVILAQSFYLLITKNIKQIVWNGIALLILYLPWIPTLVTQFKTSGPMWMYPIDIITVTSVLGNVYFGYEGTPGNLWFLMQLFSLGFLGIVLWTYKQKQKRQEFLLFITWVFVPLIIVLLISLVKPIYVHRYVIFVAIGEVFLVSLFLNSLKNKRVQAKMFMGILLIHVFINIACATFHQKVNLQKTFNEIQTLLQPGDVIYAKSPLVYYESLYYAPKTTPVFLYNPSGIIPPRYVGSGGMGSETWARNYPVFPSRAFVVSEDGTVSIQSTLVKT